MCWVPFPHLWQITTSQPSHTQSFSSGISPLRTSALQKVKLEDGKAGIIRTNHPRWIKMNKKEWLNVTHFSSYFHELHAFPECFYDKRKGWWENSPCQRELLKKQSLTVTVMTAVLGIWRGFAELWALSPPYPAVKALICLPASMLMQLGSTLLTSALFLLEDRGLPCDPSLFLSNDTQPGLWWLIYWHQTSKNNLPPMNVHI